MGFRRGRAELALSCLYMTLGENSLQGACKLSASCAKRISTETHRPFYATASQTPHVPPDALLLLLLPRALLRPNHNPPQTLPLLLTHLHPLQLLLHFRSSCIEEGRVGYSLCEERVGGEEDVGEERAGRGEGGVDSEG